MGWVRDFLRKEPQDMFFGLIEPAATPAAATPSAATPAAAAVAPESGYLHLDLEAMRVSAVRVRSQTFYGSVTSTCGVESHAGRAELVAVSTPSTLRGVDSKHLDRVITATVPLLDAVPYRGGGLDVEIGLFAFPESYLAGPYLDFLGDVAAVASAFLPTAAAGLAAAALLPPVRKGLDHLFGAATGAVLEVGLVHTWDPPVTGHYAVVRGPQPSGGFRLGQGGKLLNPDGAEVRDPYLVLRLDARPQRHNWRDIPDVAAAYATVKAAALSGDFKAVTWALETFRRVAVFSPDLIAEDGKRLYATVKKQTEDALPATATGALVPVTGIRDGSAAAFPDLADIDIYGT
jgi:hypothetical protein